MRDAIFNEERTEKCPTLKVPSSTLLFCWQRESVDALGSEEGNVNQWKMDFV
jgi:hypothetical protein